MIITPITSYLPHILSRLCVLFNFGSKYVQASRIFMLYRAAKCRDGYLSSSRSVSLLVSVYFSLHWHYSSSTACRAHWASDVIWTLVEYQAFKQLSIIVSCVTYLAYAIDILIIVSCFDVNGSNLFSAWCTRGVTLSSSRQPVRRLCTSCSEQVSREQNYMGDTAEHPNCSLRVCINPPIYQADAAVLIGCSSEVGWTVVWLWNCNLPGTWLEPTQPQYEVVTQRVWK